MTKAKEAAHITAIRKQWALKTLAAKRPHFKFVKGKSVPYTISTPEAMDVVVADAEKSLQKEDLNGIHIGQMIPNKGVYVGTWVPKDRDGGSLGTVFYVFAAPQDLKNESGKTAQLNFNDAAKQTSEIKNWYGHDGSKIANDRDLYTALEDGSYKGEWFIPTCDLLAGADVDGKDIHEESLYKNKGIGALMGTFTIASSEEDFADWYWSCTEKRNDPSRAGNIKFSDNSDNDARPAKTTTWDTKDLIHVSTRLVRVEPLL